MITPEASALLLFVISCIYGALVQLMFRRWPSSRAYTFFTVIVGVAMTGVFAVPAIGLVNVVIFAGYFVVSGLPVCLAAMIAHILEDEEQASQLEARGQVYHGLAEEQDSPN